MSLSFSIRACLSALLTAAALTVGSLSAEAIRLGFNYTMPAGIDPDRKIFFAFSGDSALFTGRDLIAGVPGVEFHTATGSGLQVDTIVLSVEGDIPDCLTPLTGAVESQINAQAFPSVTVPWLDVAESPFPLTLQSQPGAVLVGQPIASTAGFGLAFGTLELDRDTTNLIADLDAECLEAFRLLQFRATGFGSTAVPEPGAMALLCGALLSGGLLYRRRKQARE